MQWKKIKDEYKEKFFENKSPNTIVNRIELFLNYSCIYFMFNNREELEKFCQPFKNSLVPFEINTFDVSLSLNETHRPYKDFLRAIAKFDLSLQEIMPKICKFLNINPILLGLDVAQLKTLSVSNAIAQAVKAQKMVTLI